MRTVEYLHFGIVIVHEIDEESPVHRLVIPSENVEGEWVGWITPATVRARQLDFEMRFEGGLSSESWTGKLLCLVPVSKKPPEQKKKEKK